MANEIHIATAGSHQASSAEATLPSVAAAGTINTLISALAAAGGGRAVFFGGRGDDGGNGDVKSYQIEISGPIIIKTGVHLDFGGCTIHLANGANCNVIETENFASLIGQNRWEANPDWDASTQGDETMIPADFSITNVTIDGNKANQTSGRGIAIYGKRYVVDKVFIYDCKGDGLYSECGKDEQYTRAPGADPDASPSTREWHENPEAYLDRIRVHNCGGDGIEFRGPCESIFGQIFSSNNAGWGWQTLEKEEGQLGENMGFATAGAGPPAAEDWLEGGAGTVTRNASGRTGYCLEVPATGAATTTVAYQDITVTAGITYRFSFWYKGDGTNKPKFAVKDQTSGQEAYLLSTPKAVKLASTSWCREEAQFTAPAECNTIRLELWCPNAVSTKSYFDDLVFWDVNQYQGGCKAQFIHTYGNITGGVKVATFSHLAHVEAENDDNTLIKLDFQGIKIGYVTCYGVMHTYGLWFTSNADFCSVGGGQVRGGRNNNTHYGIKVASGAESSEVTDIIVRGQGNVSSGRGYGAYIEGSRFRLTGRMEYQRGTGIYLSGADDCCIDTVVHLEDPGTPSGGRRAFHYNTAGKGNVVRVGGEVPPGKPENGDAVPNYGYYGVAPDVTDLFDITFRPTATAVIKGTGRSRNGGTHTLVGTSDDIAHGLVATPTRVAITPKAADGALYVSVVDATKITVHGADGDQFYWTAEL